MIDEPKYKLISKLEADGSLNELVQSGFCSPCVFRNLEVYRRIDALVKTGMSRNEALIDVEVTFRMCRRSVYNVIKSFK